MPTLNLEQDILPVSEFRNNASNTIERIKTQDATVILTQNGRAVAALLSIPEYQRLLNELSELRSMGNGLTDALQGQTTPHTNIKTKLKRVQRDG